MKTFLYRGFRRDGVRCKGAIEAHDIKDAREKLSQAGILPEHLESAVDGPKSTSRFASRASSLNRLQARTEFYRALSALLKAGLPMAGAFEVMIDQPGGGSSHHEIRDIAGIRDRIRDGAGLAQAMVDANITTSAYESAVLETGEKTGKMYETLTQLADYLDDVGKLRGSIINACIYPAIIIALAVVIGAGIMGILVPQMAELFSESGMELPWITRIVVGIGHVFLPLLLPILFLVIILALLLFRRVRANTEKRITLERLLARLPFLRGGFNYLVAARFSRTCAMLLRAGLPLIDAMTLSGRATGSLWLAHILRDKADAVRHGQAFSQAIAEVPVLGTMLSSWIRAGEASGDLAGLLQHAAERNQLLWNDHIKRLSAIIEPALIVLVAVLVLIVALAIILPILSLNQQVM
ncbi:MAG TPA: type II secretion system F family protein [Kiritimatiellia bacterium]|nr:type II secretion system F family protein [Kiritimatiellia bacterium]